MKILMLTPYLPYPLISGGQIRSYNLLKNLARKHEITLIALIKHDNEEKYIDNISPYCRQVIVAKRPQKPWTPLNIIRTGFGWYPFLVIRNFSREAKSAVIRELKKNTYELIHAETFYVMPHIPKTRVPILLVEQTIEYLVYQHFVGSLRWPPVKALFLIDVAKIKFWERHFWRKASRVVAMSDSDRKVMKKMEPNLDVSIVPNGIDPAFFKYRQNVPAKTPTLLFVGNFKWLQNREAVMKLVTQIWPVISKSIPGAKLKIVGKFPPPEITTFSHKQIEVIDTIEDIRDAYRKADILLAPIYGPGGTRYKILEAMASGVPVVTTPQGVEGLGVKDGKEVIVKKTVYELSLAAVKILTNAKLYQEIAVNANRLVREKYNWHTIATKLGSLYETVAHEKG